MTEEERKRVERRAIKHSLRGGLTDEEWAANYKPEGPTVKVLNNLLVAAFVLMWVYIIWTYFL
jgi:hypothetical protein